MTIVQNMMMIIVQVGEMAQLLTSEPGKIPIIIRNLALK
jgi:hypothetical protein